MAHVILGLLIAVGPQTVYSLNKFFDAGISLFYAASLGALRSALQRLLADGHVTVEEQTEAGRAKKLYSATESGRAAFHAWMLAAVTERDLEVTALSKLYFLGALPDRGERRAVLDRIAERAAADEARLTRLAAMIDGEEVPEQFRELAHYQRLTVEYGLRSHALGRTFFEELAAVERAESAPAQAGPTAADRAGGAAALPAEDPGPS